MDGVRIMGVVNVTPDSFSDGGLYLEPGPAIDHGRELAAQGAEILDVGGESTRPGAEEVGAAEERSRTEPVVRGLSEALAAEGISISIDTSKLAVAEAALEAGATIVNDVTALRADPDIAAPGRRARRRPGAHAHARQPADHAASTRSTTTSSTTSAPSSPSGPRRRSPPASPRRGSGSIPESASARPSSTTSSCCGDWGRSPSLGMPVVVGASRKSFIGKIDGSDVGERLGGTIAASVLAATNGAEVLRVHDVDQMAQALRVAAAIAGPPPPPPLA